jgi:hypothetical protein
LPNETIEGAQLATNTSAILKQWRRANNRDCTNVYSEILSDAAGVRIGTPTEPILPTKPSNMGVSTKLNSEVVEQAISI